MKYTSMSSLMLAIVVVVSMVSAGRQSGTCGKPSIKSDRMVVKYGRLSEATMHGIVGGHEATPNSWPWQVQVRAFKTANSRSYFSCGGSILDKNTILTAAHCLDRPGFVDVIAGQHDTGKYSERTRQKCNARTYINHSGYGRNGKADDIAIIKLDCELRFNDYVQPICLPSASEKLNVAGRNVVIAGWGALRFKGNSPSQLNEVMLKTSDVNACQRKYGYSRRNVHWVCAIGRGKDSCQGDSGGPLIAYNKGRFVQAGVVSFGVECAKPGVPGVYTHVTDYLDWISRYLN